MVSAATCTPAPQTVTASWIPKRALQLVHLVLDFDPGVWTPRHLHDGQELVTLTAGDKVRPTGITAPRAIAKRTTVEITSWPLPPCTGCRLSPRVAEMPDGRGL